MCPYHMRPDDLLFFACQHEFDKTSWCVLCLRTVDLCPRKSDDTHLPVTLLCFLRGQSNTSGFRVRKRTPGKDPIIDLLLSHGQQGVSHRYSRLIGRHVCKKIFPKHVAESKDMSCRGLKIAIHLN